jgi:hypothetical protein
MKTIKLKDILSISGKSGLFRYIAEARNGIVVESIEDQKRHVAPATARVSSLEDIAVFTTDEEIPLSDLFMMIHEAADGGEALSHKSTPDELKAHFRELLPEYDEERVYLSDIKKVFQWYNQLHSKSLLEVVEKEEESEDAVQDDVPEEEKPAAEKRPAAEKKPATKEKPASEKKSGAK